MITPKNSKKNHHKLVFQLILLLVIGGKYSISLAQYSSKNLFSLESQRDKANDPSYYPSINITTDNYKQLLKKAIYPKEAREKILESLVLIKFTVDTLGNTNDISYEENKGSYFAESAKEIVKASSGLWIPGIRNGHKTEITITIPISYSIKINTEGKFIYTIQFTPYFELIVDSIVNPVPLLRETARKGEYIFYHTRKEVDLKSVDIVSSYGTVTLKFQVDTNGIVSDINIINSFSEELDIHALNFIKSTSRKWIPAQVNGSKINSYIEFDMMYYLARNRNNYPSYQHSSNNREELVHWSDYKLAIKYYDDGEFKLAEPLFNKVCMYYIRTPQIFYYQALNFARLKENSKACESMKKANELAKQYDYEGDMEKQEVEDFISNYCPEQTAPSRMTESPSK